MRAERNKVVMLVFLLETSLRTARQSVNVTATNASDIWPVGQSASGMTTNASDIWPVGQSANCTATNTSDITPAGQSANDTATNSSDIWPVGQSASGKTTDTSYIWPVGQSANDTDTDTTDTSMERQSANGMATDTSDIQTAGQFVNSKATDTSDIQKAGQTTNDTDTDTSDTSMEGQSANGMATDTSDITPAGQSVNAMSTDTSKTSADCQQETSPDATAFLPQHVIAMKPQDSKNENITYSDEWLITWNATTTTSQQFQLAVCSNNASYDFLGIKNRDFSEDTVDVSEYSDCCHQRCLSVTCFQCADLPTCQAYGSCCSYLGRGSAGEDTYSKDQQGRVGCTTGYYSIVQCPLDWQGTKDVKQACENGTGTYTYDEPVSDPETSLVYRNAACAACHGVSNSTAWMLNVTCQHVQFLYAATSQQDLLVKVLDRPDLCSVKYSPPPGFPVSPQCSQFTVPWFSQEVVVEDCNATGEWAEYDQRVEAACRSLTALVYRVYHHDTDRLYANIFCGLCNGMKIEEVDCGSIDDKPIIGGPIFGEKAPVAPLSFLFGIHQGREDEDHGVRDCARNVWLPLQNQCRNLTCTAGKTLVNGTCVTAVSMIAGLTYTLDASFVLTPPVHSSSSLRMEICQQLREQIRKSFQNYSSSLLIDIRPVERFRPSTAPTTSARYEVKLIRLSGDVTASRTMTRDQAEQAFVNNLFTRGWSITVNNLNVSLTPKMIVCKTKPESGQCKENEECLATINEVLSSTEKELKFKLKITPMLVCPYLAFSHSDFSLQLDEDGEIMERLELMYGNDRMVLPQDDGSLLTWVDEGVLYVCQEAFGKLSSAVPEKVMSWQTMLSLIVLPMSLLCLLLTLVVYSLLPALRTLPGLNVMGTCLALFLAQLSLLLASQRALSGLGPWCRALGMLVHAAWLSFFSWTWLCSLHMYRAFSANTFRPSAPRLALRLARNLAFTLLLPALLVALVVAVSYFTSGGQTMGYSDERCYLDSALLVCLSVILPVALLVTVNIVLFLLTARRIHQVSKLSPHSDKDHESQHHVYVCLRLSVLTGATWVLSLIAETLDVDWLQSVSIVANGGQGVLLFLSYVVSRRVAAMLAVRLGLKEESFIVQTSLTASDSKSSPDLSVSHRKT